MTGDGSGFSGRTNRLEVTQVIIANARSLSQSGVSASNCLTNMFSVPKKCFPAVLDLVFDFLLSFCEAVLDRFMFDAKMLNFFTLFVARFYRRKQWSVRCCCSVCLSQCSVEMTIVSFVADKVM